MFLVWAKTFVIVFDKAVQVTCSEEDKSNARRQTFFFFFPSWSISFTQKVGTQTWGKVVLLSIRKHMGAKGCLQKSPVPRMECVT